MTGQSILIIAAGPLQMPVFEEARRQGLRIIAVDGNPSAPGLEYADSAHVLALDDYQGIATVAEQEGVTAVTSLCTDFAVRAVAYVAGHLGLPGLAFEAARDSTDKRRMRRRFLEVGAPSVPFREVSGLGSAMAAAHTLGYPVALKAPRSAGCRGVFRVDSDQEMGERFPDSRRYESSGALLVETWMEGPEVSVEGCCFEGRIHIVRITDKLVYAGASPVEAGHTQGSRLPADVQRGIQACAIAGIRALAMDNCGFHAEIKACRGGPRIIEIAARLGGDRIATHLTPLSTGVDLVCAILDISLGKAPGVEPKWNRGAAIRYFDAGRSGAIAAIHGLEDIREMPGFELLLAGTDSGEPLEPGYRVRAIQSSLDRYGYAIFSGDDADHAAARAERAVAVEFDFVAGGRGVARLREPRWHEADFYVHERE
jgi:biotin carboxylase